MSQRSRMQDFALALAKSNQDMNEFCVSAADREAIKKLHPQDVKDLVAAYAVVAKETDWVRRSRRLAKLANFEKNLQIFGGLVLDCIKTKFCE